MTTGTNLQLEMLVNGTIANAMVDQSTTANGGIEVCPGGGTVTTMSGPISGSGSLNVGSCIVNNPGTVVLGPASGDAYTGGTAVTLGTLADGVANAVPTTGTLDVGAGSTFDMAGFNQSVAGLSGAGTVLDSVPSSASILTDTAGTTTFSGVLENNSGTGGTVALIVNGAVLTLSGTNTYSGGTTVTSGTLTVSNSSALGTGAVASVAAGATLAVSGAWPTNNITSLSGTLESTGSSHWGGTIGLGAATAAIEDNGVGDFGIEGAITGNTYPVAFTGSSPGIELWAANSFVGATVAATTSVAPYVSGALGTSGTITVSAGGVVVLNTPNAVGSGVTLDIAGTGSGFAAALIGNQPGATWSGPVVLTGNTSFSPGTSSDTLIVGGVISDGGHNYALTTGSRGSGTTTLSAANTYTGGTTVAAGTLELTNSSALGATSGVLVDSAADLMLDVAGGASYSKPLTLGSGNGYGAVLEGVTSGNTWSGTVTLAASSLGWFTADASNTLTISGPVTGSGALDTNGTGTVVLTNANDNYTGATTAGGASGFTLDVTGTVSASAVTVDSGATLEGTGTIDAIASNLGTVAPGSPSTPGILDATGAVNLDGSVGTFDVEVTGATPGSGYSQLSSTSTVNLGSALLSVTDAYAAPYGTVFTIVSSSGSGTPVSGTFSGDPGGTVITTSGGRKLLVGYAANDVTLTDVTNPPPPPTGPMVSGISPVAGSTGGGTSVTITGTGFTGATAVAFGGTPAASFKVVSDTEITAISPAGISGPVDVEVTTPSGTSAAVAADQFSYQADFTGVAPSRICDTRSGNPSALSGGAAQCNGKTLATNTSLIVNVGGLGGVPGTGVSAVVLNVTVTNPTAGGYLTVYPAGQSAPLASNLNFSAGETVANLVEVGLSQGGQIAVVTNAKSADVIVDVEGYVSALPTAGQGLYDGLTPARICDTRSSSLPANQCTGKTMKPNSTMTVQVAGLGGVPANAEAVAVNVTVTDTTAAGYLTVFPGGARPTASNLNWASGRTVANLVVVELNSSGGLTLYNYAGSTDVVLDVLGYYTAAGGSGPQFNALAKPVRICDTRSSSQPSNQCTGKTMAQNSTMVVQVAGLAGVPADAQAVVLNVTATNTSASGYLTVYPGGTRPLASNLNWTSGQTVPNLVISRLSSSGQVTLYNFAGSTDVIVDVMGWYS
ncbi:MAG: beta strand repeat-containing protein [Candidatus Dormibacteria bacterium]